MMQLKNEIQTNALLLPAAKGCFSRKYNGILSHDRWHRDDRPVGWYGGSKRRGGDDGGGIHPAKGYILLDVVLVLA